MPRIDIPDVPSLTRAGIVASALLVALATALFGRRQRQTGRPGGPIALGKLLWLGLVVHLGLLLPAVLVLTAPLGPVFRAALGLFAGLFWLRAGVELWLMYGPGRWRAPYGIAHDTIAVAVAWGAAWASSAVVETSADLLAWSLLLILGVLMTFETIFAVLHYRVVGEGTTGDGAVWFAPPGDPAFRVTRRLTRWALALLLPAAGIWHGLALWAPAAEEGAALGARVETEAGRPRPVGARDAARGETMSGAGPPKAKG